MFPLGWVMVRERLGWMVSCQPPSWTAWWCLKQSGTRLSRLVGPNLVVQVTWWGWQWREGTGQVGGGEGVYMGVRGRGCLGGAGLAGRPSSGETAVLFGTGGGVGGLGGSGLRVASLTASPSSRQTPLLLSTVGMIAAWQAMRR